MIDREAIRANYRELTRRLDAKTRIMAMLKGNAYGHGAPEVARLLEREGVHALGVGTVEEGVELRDAGIAHPEVFLLGGFTRDQVEDIFQHRLTPLVCNLEMAEMLNQRLRGYSSAFSVHLKVDTGLGGLGVSLTELPDFLQAMKKLDRLELAGLGSHLASDPAVDGEPLERQIASFVRASELCAIHGSPVQCRHFSNSATVLYRPDLDFEMVRPGLSLYGLYPGSRPDGPVPLRPAMTLKTIVLQLRDVPAGTSIGFDRAFVTERDSRIGVLPVGYADGYPRSLSNRGQVLVRGRRASVLGNVFMDTTVVDVTDVPGVEVNDEVVLWGFQDSAELRIDEVAEWAGRVPCELFATVGKRIPRAFVN